MSIWHSGYDRVVELHMLAEAGDSALVAQLNELALIGHGKHGEDRHDFEHRKGKIMFIAMNRFKVREGHEEEFENVWKNRDSRLTEVPGFETFHLLRGEFDDKSRTTLFASHTVWATKDDFIAWTKSEYFRAAHRNAGGNAGMYDGHPNFEGFEAVLGE